MTDARPAPGYKPQTTTKGQTMQLFAVTIEATAQRTITLAASSLAEAQATALDLFELPADTLDLQVVEAMQLQGATA